MKRRTGRRHLSGAAMKYALLVYEDESQFDPEKAGPHLRELVGKHMAFSQELGPKRIGGAGLKGTSTATTVRTKAGKKTMHDGPFAEAREQLGGFYLVDVSSLDEAIEIAQRIPLAKDGAIEVRPVLGP
jgi:hypothetical protein